MFHVYLIFCSAVILPFTSFFFDPVHFPPNKNKPGEWGKMNARDRGAMIMKLADLMDRFCCNIFDESFNSKDKLIMNKDKLMTLTLLRDKEELATIESIDSGAVYTLALKTHVGMSIATWRYFAGW